MVFARLARNMVQRRTFSQSAVRFSDHDNSGIPGSNVPFDITNKYKLAVYFVLFFGSAFGVPFVAVRHQLLK